MLQMFGYVKCNSKRKQLRRVTLYKTYCGARGIKHFRKWCYWENNQRHGVNSNSASSRHPATDDFLATACHLCFTHMFYCLIKERRKIIRFRGTLKKSSNCWLFVEMLHFTDKGKAADVCLRISAVKFHPPRHHSLVIRCDRNVFERCWLK